MPAFYVALGWMVLVVMLPVATMHCITLVRTQSSFVRADTGMNLLVDLYFVGTACKFAVVGPAFIRWHLGDIGFPAALALLFLMPIAWRSFQRQSETPVPADELVYYRAFVLGRVVWLAVAVSVVYELVAGYGAAHGSNPTPFVGGFDWIDVGCYMVGGLLAWRTQHNLLRRLTPRSREGTV